MSTSVLHPSKVELHLAVLELSASTDLDDLSVAVRITWLVNLIRASVLHLRYVYRNVTLLFNYLMSL